MHTIELSLDDIKSLDLTFSESNGFYDLFLLIHRLLAKKVVKLRSQIMSIAVFKSSHFQLLPTKVKIIYEFIYNISY